MQAVEFVYVATMPSDCVFGGCVILCACGCPDGVDVSGSCPPSFVGETTVWGWQDNAGAGNGLQHWQDNVNPGYVALGKWQ